MLLYHILKLIIPLFDHDADRVLTQTTLVENIRLNAMLYGG